MDILNFLFGEILKRKASNLYLILKMWPEGTLFLKVHFVLCNLHRNQ